MNPVIWTLQSTSQLNSFQHLSCSPTTELLMEKLLQHKHRMIFDFCHCVPFSFCPHLLVFFFWNSRYAIACIQGNDRVGEAEKWKKMLARSSSSTIDFLACTCCYCLQNPFCFVCLSASVDATAEVLIIPPAGCTLSAAISFLKDKKKARQFVIPVFH